MDFDGTLARFAARPEAVKLSAATRSALGRLARHRKVHVIIISGRRRAELIRHVRTRGIRYFGLFGWEGGNRTLLPRRTRRTLSLARRSLVEPLRKFLGIRVQDKGAGFAVHYRGANPAAVRTARGILHEGLRRFEPDLRILDGDKVWEIVPRQVEGKGPAIRRALKADGRSFLPIYLGNDETDESAFYVLRQGITVHVGPARPTQARYRLRNPDEVRRFLERLEGALP